MFYGYEYHFGVYRFIGVWHIDLDQDLGAASLIVADRRYCTKNPLGVKVTLGDARLLV